MQATDVVVIGAGIIGSTTAYYLAKAGIQVTLLDRKERITSGTASQANAGGVRQQGRSIGELPLAMHSIHLWKNLEKELDADLHYRRGGMTYVIDDESQFTKMLARVEKERAQGLDIRLLNSAELHELVPGLSFKILGGSYCPTDGHADPIRTTNAFAVAARRSGAKIKGACPAQSLIAEKGTIRGVKTAKGAISCRHVILAAGAWSLPLAATVGVDMPVRPGLLQAMVTVPHSHVLEQVLSWVGHGISVKQVPSGGFVIGGGWQGRGDPSHYEANLEPASMSKSAQTTIRLFPAIERVPILRAWVGIEAFCVDDEPIISQVPGVNGLVIATGFSAHGFALGPGVGALLAEYLATDQWPEILAPFSITRFQRQKEEQ